MNEDILFNNPVKLLLGPKPLRPPSRSLRVDIKGILGDTQKPTTPSFNPSWEELSSWVDTERDTATKFENIEYDDAPVDYQLLVDKIMSLRPINQSETLFGIDTRAPSRSEQSIFKRQMSVLEDPTSVVRLLKEGRLSPLEVEALQMFYPNYYDELTFAVLDLITSGKPEELTRNKKAQLGILLGVPRVSPEAIQKLQEQYTQEPTEGADAPNVAEGQITDAQRVEFNQ